MNERVPRIAFGVVIAASFATLAVVAVLALSRGRMNLAEDLGYALPSMLEDLYQEGYFRTEVDYDDPVLAARTIYLTTDLDEREAEAVMRKLKYLELKDAEAPIDLFIQTEGGTGGVALANYIQTLKPPVNTIALGFCASAGCEVLASGTGKRRAFESSRIIVHIVRDVDYDNDAVLFTSSRNQDAASAAFWSAHSTMEPQMYRTVDETFYNFTAEEAQRYGIIDEIVPNRAP